MAGNIRTFVLMAAMTALVMGMGYLIGGQGGAVIALVFAGAGNLWAWWNSDKAVLRQQGATRVARQHAHHGRAVVAIERVLVEQAKRFAGGAVQRWQRALGQRGLAGAGVAAEEDEAGHGAQYARRRPAGSSSGCGVLGGPPSCTGWARKGR